MTLLVPEQYALGHVRDSVERFSLAATSNKTGSRLRDGFLRDPDGRLVVAPSASGTWQQGFLRDADGALCVTSGAGTMQSGFLRDAVGRLIVASAGEGTPWHPSSSVSPTPSVPPRANVQGLPRDAAGRLAITEPYDSTEPVAASDSFTGSDGTLLTSHAPEAGGSWVKHPISSVANVVLRTNRAHLTGSGTTIMHVSATPGTTDYDVSVSPVLITDNNSSVAGVVGRFDPTINEGVSAHYNTTDDAWKLFETVAGVNGPVTSIPGTLTGQRVTLRLRGSQASLLLDGVEIAAITTTVLTAGRAGVRFGGSGGTTIGVHLDDFEVTEVAKLSWAPPDTTGWVAVNATNANRSFTGDDTTSLVVTITEPITALGGLTISNYINVVIIGGEIDASALGVGRTAAQMVGIKFASIRGWVFLEGLLIKGAPAAPGDTPGAIGDAVTFNNITAGLWQTRVTIQNCRFEHLRSDSLDQQNGTGTYVGNEAHADANQHFGAAAGRGLQMDRVSIQTLYQGLFTQAGTPLGCMDLRRVNIDGAVVESYSGGAPTSSYLLYASSDNTLPRWISCQDVYVKAPDGKSRHLYISHDLTGSTIGTPGIPNRSFRDAVDGVPPGGDFCPSGTPGMTYVSPGYRWA